MLNAAGVACKNYHEADGTFVYKTLHLFDSPREDISPMLYAAVEFIDAAIEGGGRVYIHCHQGVSRSSMANAYLEVRHQLRRGAGHAPNVRAILDRFPESTAGRAPPSPTCCPSPPHPLPASTPTPAYFILLCPSTRSARGVCNPNAGFICRLLAFGKDIHAKGPPSPPRLYRLSSLSAGP